MNVNEIIPQKENLGDVLKKIKEQQNNEENKNFVNVSIPNKEYNPNDFQNIMSKETDPDLMTSYEIVPLPSKGIFYKNGLSEVNVEYMTSKDEDLLTTPSLIENGSVLDLLLKRKIKTPNVNPEDLLPGDRNAIILFLRTSSYGTDYKVQVSDPRNGGVFEETVDLLKLKYKEPSEMPNEEGYFSVDLPMRKKNVVFKLLTSGQDTVIYKKSESLKEVYGSNFSEYNTLKLKSSIVSIDGKTDKFYIDKFVDAMPALDAFTIRKKILEVSPDVDMSYEFTAKDGHKFKGTLSVGIDFFFPSL